MTALPNANADDFPSPNVNSAYGVCRRFEKDALSRGSDQDVIRARVLGHLIRTASSSNALADIVMGIHSCAEDYIDLSQLGKAYIDYFIRPFKKFKGRTPASSHHPSRPSFDVKKSELVKTISEAPKSHKDAKFKALVRDNYRCVVTGKIDASVPLNQRNPGATVFTQLAHILPESTYFDVKDSGAKKDYSASVLAVLSRFGYNIDKLNGEKVHSLENVMTMESNVHDWFDRLLIWFEKTAIPDTYIVKSCHPGLLKKGLASITFTTTDPNLPLPSPELLALHATCAQVAHLSGAGEYIDKLWDDWESMGVLAQDGTSSGVLNHAIMSRMRHVDVSA